MRVDIPTGVRRPCHSPVGPARRAGLDPPLALIRRPLMAIWLNGGSGSDRSSFATGRSIAAPCPSPTISGLRTTPCSRDCWPRQHPWRSDAAP